MLQIKLKTKNIILVSVSAIVASIFTVYISQGLSSDYDRSNYQVNMNSMKYDLLTPVQRWELPEELEEISGLSYYRENQLACIQDEEGIFFIYDLQKSKVVRREKFGEKGDYEAVEVINDTAYVLKSNGDIYFFRVENQGIGDINKIKTDLTKYNDTEGLGFDQNENELLISCKEAPGTKEVELEKSRTIYSIILPEKKFQKNPKYAIDAKSYNEMLVKKGLSKKEHKPFKPSGIAIHPQTNYIFIIGSVGKMMVILNPQGVIEDLIPLDPKLFLQPEGFCFSPGGDLYISSEGQGKKGYILKF